MSSRSKQIDIRDLLVERQLPVAETIRLFGELTVGALATFCDAVMRSEPQLRRPLRLSGYGANPAYVIDRVLYASMPMPGVVHYAGESIDPGEVAQDTVTAKSRPSRITIASFSGGGKVLVDNDGVLTSWHGQVATKPGTNISDLAWCIVGAVAAYRVKNPIVPKLFARADLE